MAELIPVATVEEIPDGKARQVAVANKDIAVFRIGDEYFAIGNDCPHYGAALCEGYVRDEAVVCPWHGWRFDLRTGKGLTVPGCDVESFGVKVEDGAVKLVVEP